MRAAFLFACLWLSGEVFAERSVTMFVGLTGRPSSRDVELKLDGLKGAGVDSFLLYPTSGLQMEYLGEEFFDCAVAFAAGAERRGMKMWLYDEYNWPSGSCRGRVPAEDERFRYAEIALSRRQDGTLAWGKVLGPRGWVNLLEPKAVRRFIELTHLEYERRLGRWMRNGTIRGFFTDEPGHPVDVKLPSGVIAHCRWYDGLEADYLAETGRDFRRDVETWAEDPSRDDVWPAYRRLCGRRFRTAYYDQIRAETDRLGLELTGHLVNDAWADGAVRDNGDPLLALTGESLPGIDAIRSVVNPEEIPFFLYALADYAARKQGRGAMCELFACGPADMPAARMRKMIWLAAFHGVTRYFTVQSAMDASWQEQMRGFMTTVGEYQPWFAEFRTVLDEADRASAFASKRHVCDVAIRFPQTQIARMLASGSECKLLADLLTEIEISGFTPELIGETEDSVRPVVFAVDGENVVDERSGRRFDTVKRAVEHLAGAVRVDGRRRNVLLRRLDDGTRMELDLNADRETALTGSPVADRWSLALNAPVCHRIPFGPSREVTVCATKGLKDVRLVAREFVPNDVSDAVHAIEGQPMCGAEGERLRTDPYRFSLDGTLVDARTPASSLRPTFNSLYRETEPFSLEEGVHRLRIVAGGDDDNYFLPALFLTGDFVETKGELSPRPKTVGFRSLADIGLSGFSGVATYMAPVDIPNRAGVRLAVDSGNAFVRVRLGDRDLGVRAWAPFEWAIPGEFAGKRVELAISIYTSVLPIFGMERPGTTVPKGRWPISDSSSRPGLRACTFVDDVQAFAELAKEVKRRMSGSSGTMRRRRALKRLKMAARLSGRAFEDLPMRADELRQFRQYADDEMRFWERNPLNPGVDATVLNVADFGARADGRTDATPAFAAALAKVRERGGSPTILEVPAGEYLLLGGGPRDRRTGDRGHITLESLTNLVVRGAGPERTRLVFGDREMTGLAVRRCENTVVRGLELQWRDPLFCQGTVECFDREGGFVVLKVHPGTMVPTDPHYRLSPIKMQVCSIFDPSGKIRLGKPVFFTNEAKDLGDGRFRVELDKTRSGYASVEIPKGSILVIPDRWGTHSAVTTPGSRFCDFEELWIRNSPSAAFSASFGEYVTGYRCRVFPVDGLVFSTNADTFYNSRGTYIADCEFRAMGDDGANSLVRSGIIRRQKGPRTLIYECRGGSYRPGDAMQVYRSTTGELLATLHIVKSEIVKADGAYSCRTEFREDIPAGIITQASLEARELGEKEKYALSHGLGTVKDVPDMIYAPQSFGVSFVCSGNRFASLRGIGINTQCSNSLIENNVIENVNTAIKVSALMQWFEGPPPYNVVIRGNVLRNVIQGVASQHDTINGTKAVGEQIVGLAIVSNQMENVLIPTDLRNAADPRIAGNEIVRDGGQEGKVSFSRCGDWQVKVTANGRSRTFAVEPPPRVGPLVESFVLPDYDPKAWCMNQGWIPSGAKSPGGNPTKFAIDPESVRIRRQDGTELTRGVDWQMNEWGCLGRLAASGRVTNEIVRVEYVYRLMRTDAIVLRNGELAYVRGEPAKSAPRIPLGKDGDVFVGSVDVRPETAALGEENLFPVLEREFGCRLPECERAESRCPNVWKKLQAGKPVKILCWGDSVTEGTYGGLESPESCWQVQFRARLRKVFPKSDIRVVTNGWGGRGTADFLAAPEGDVRHHYPTSVLGQKADLVIIEFVNDLYLSGDGLRERYGKIVADFRARGSEVLFMIPHYIRFDRMGFLSQKDTDVDPRPYAKDLKRLAKEWGVGIVDPAARWGHLWKEGVPYMNLLVNDYNHPNGRGMSFFADALMDFFGENACVKQERKNK